MKKIYLEEFNINKVKYDEVYYPDWEEIENPENLFPVITDILLILNVLMVKQKKRMISTTMITKEKKKGICAIAIGGDKLSRGLTLKV